MSKKDEAKAAIAAAKVPVQEWMNKRTLILDALEKHDAAGHAAIGKLVEVAGANGPFRFEQGRYNFRKEREGTGFTTHLDKEKGEM